MWLGLRILAALALGAGIFFWVRRLRRTYYVTEYFFFVRFPLLLAAAVIVLPFLGYSLAPNMFGVLFVLRPVGIALVVFAACCCGWSIVYGAAVLVYSIPFRARLNYRRA